MWEKRSSLKEAKKEHIALKVASFHICILFLVRLLEQIKPVA